MANLSFTSFSVGTKYSFVAKSFESWYPSRQLLTLKRMLIAPFSKVILIKNFNSLKIHEIGLDSGIL